MACFDRNAQLQTLILEFLHEGHHARRNRAKIVILQLLILGRLVPHQRASGEHQVGTYGPQTLIHQKILLLPAQVGVHLLHVAVKVVADLRGGFIHGRNRT